MKPSQAKIAIKTAIKAKRPIFIWGPPGVGKSQVVKQISEENGTELIDTRAILLDPVDLRGLPCIENKKAVWCSPGFFPSKGKGIWFIDELNAAPPLVQAAFYQLILDRKLGEYSLPDNWAIVAAGNRETDRAVTSRMPSALANRFVHIQFDVDLEDWVAWALNHGITQEVISFLRFRPGLLFSFDAQKNEKSFPTPRSWEFVSDLLKTIEDKSIEYELISGTVGEGPSSEFAGFLKIHRNLPDIDKLLEHPNTARMPSDPAILYAVSGALVGKTTVKTIPAIIEYANRMPAEFSVLTIRDAEIKCHEITETKAFQGWVLKHKDIIF